MPGALGFHSGFAEPISAFFFSLRLWTAILRFTVKKQISSLDAASRKVHEVEPYNKRKIDITTFTPDISPKDWVKVFKPFVPKVATNSIFYYPIETLSPTKTIGKGRTNLTIIMSTIVQIDAATPYAGFDMRATPSRKPIIQMHFEPKAYGITAGSTYVMTFAIEVVGQATFNVDGSFGFISNAGSRTLSGQTTVSLIFKNVQPADQIYGYVEQKTGGSWNWFSTRVTPPPLVISL
jgi:hypothetical protein